MLQVHIIDDLLDDDVVLLTNMENYEKLFCCKYFSTFNDGRVLDKNNLNKSKILFFIGS